jgi:hypothetical protein
MHRRLALAALLAALGACRHAFPPGSTTVCPEYRELRCLSAPECSFDRARGCEVCRCSGQDVRPDQAAPPSAVPPDRRTP